ncbi:hypothetical protein BDP27DRAFT_1221728 [Rhodocollybia butyracea]|uniref:Uncharacterized protein n=1 Tax=Rhodocollybia butyracea TaxID=206335 RepID=A0A9P5PXC2_9AGAR|nr:hypothetical protein BDP27DRAFT_1221728 [Rhodocollybia butyracea]
MYERTCLCASSTDKYLKLSAYFRIRLLPSTMSNDDPRDSSLETKFKFPDTWAQDDAGLKMFAHGNCLGLIMVTRNRYLAWPGLVFAISAAINQHVLRAKEGSSGPLGNLALSTMALLASYIPLVTISQMPAAQPSS